MLFFRILVGLLGAAAIACFALYIGTRERAWLRRGVAIVKWTLLAALGFFVVLIAERLISGAG